MSTFGVIISNRSFFPDHLVRTAREKLMAAMEQWGHQVIALSPEDTFLGQTMTYEEAKKCAALFRAHSAEIEGVIVCLPNFGEETGVADAIKMSGLNVPILVQACDDDLDKLQLENRRDAYCGKLSLCSNLYQYGIPYSLTARHTCPVDSEEFHADVERFARVCAVVKALRTARIAQLGARVTPFRTVRYSEKLLQQAGISVITEDMSEIFADAWLLRDDDPRVLAREAEIRAYGNICPGIAREKVLKQAKLSLTIDQWMADHECVASAVQCWDSVEANYGCAACLSMRMMSSRGLPSACETDVMGAVSLLALLKASGVAPVYQDWDNNYGGDTDRCVNMHCSNYPAAAFREKPEIANLDILATTLGTEYSFGALKGRVRPDKMTFLKVSTDDRRGVIKCYLGQGEFTDDPLETFGGVAVCHVKNLDGLMHYVAKNGFEHHVAIVQAECADILEEALGNYLGWEVYRHS